jgi:hypothetical protein
MGTGAGNDSAEIGEDPFFPMSLGFGAPACGGLPVEAWETAAFFVVEKEWTSAVTLVARCEENSAPKRPGACGAEIGFPR